MKYALKTMLPEKLLISLRGARERIDSFLVKILAQSEMGAWIYYSFFNRGFRRECFATLQGRLASERIKIEGGKSDARLRRNIHRIEKGLIMRPRRDVFATGYILETVAMYSRASSNEEFCGEEKKWAHDVLNQYFSVVTSRTGVVGKAFTKFQSLKAPFPMNNEVSSYTPYARRQVPPLRVSYDQFAALCQRRRSVRWYRKDPVPREELEAAIEVARQAPSACNRQPFRFVLINEPAQAQEIGAIPGGTKGFAGNFPALVAVIGDLSCYPYERDRHLIYIDSSLAAMLFMLALEVRGLSSCPINWPDIKSQDVKLAGVLNLKAYERAVMLISVGYADEEGFIPYSQKKRVI